MIAFVKGTLEETEENAVVIDCGGIGYRIQVPAAVLNGLPSAGAVVKLYTHFQVKEDGMSLYGFRTKGELRFFRMLIGVNGIGPKGALAILSAMEADELRFAILTDNVKVIAKAPGIGVKTAQRIVMELKDKMSSEDLTAGTVKAPEIGRNTKPASGAAEEAVEALSALGYSSSEAYRAVKQVQITETTTVEDVLKQALKHMSFL